MAWTSDPTLVEGALEREFTLERDGAPIPGVMWSPADGTADRLVLLGHGATADKRAYYIEGVARLATQAGFDAVAIDGPGHGARAFADLPPQDFDAIPRVWHRAGGTASIIADWQATLDFVEHLRGSRPTGWWGLSMGTMVGLPLCVAEPRISLAVLGLMGGRGPNADDLIRSAPELAIPLRFLLQWDDEVVPREKGLELFGMLGSRRKTLHANPGKHSEVPVTEVVSSVEYLSRHLNV